MTRLHYTKIGLTSLALGIVYACTVTPLFAAGTYTPLVGIPGINGTPSLPEYINKLYTLTIAIGVLIAIIRIAFAGVKYSMSGVITDKSSAKNDIKGVLLGLAILLLPYIVLNTINPDLLRLNFLDDISKKINIPNYNPGGGSTTNPSGPTAAMVSSCNAQAGSQWDPTCGYCILKTQTIGSKCSAKDSPDQLTTPCSTFNLSAGGKTCESFCAGINGTYSSNNGGSCTYK
jgi:hypothetical protein